MKYIDYNLPIFTNKEKADLNQYSEKMAEAIKVQIDKFGNPLIFKGTVETLEELEYLTDVKNGYIYTVISEEKNYIYNGTEWIIYSDNQNTSLDVLMVDSLPTENIKEKTIYLVPNTETKENNVYDEYIYVNNAWEIIGNTAVDLTDYYTKTEVNNLLDDVGDTLPIGTIVEYEGDTVPDGYEEVEDEGEVYSIKEQKIGTWVNGKPLYRKVVQFLMPENPNAQQDVWVAIPHGISNIEEIPKYNITWFWDNNFYNFPDADVVPTVKIGMENIELYKHYLLSGTLVTATIEYTKTTD